MATESKSWLVDAILLLPFPDSKCCDKHQNLSRFFLKSFFVLLTDINSDFRNNYVFYQDITDNKSQDLFVPNQTPK